jgi:hypothetical protein
VHVHGLGDVLHGLIADVLEAELELALGLVVHRVRDADATGLGQPFQACGNVDPVTVEPLLASPRWIPMRNSMR